MKKCRIIILFLLWYGNYQYALCQWTSIGPWGGVCSALEMAHSNADTMYAAFPSGLLYKSTNRGVNWNPINFGTSVFKVTKVLVHPRVSNIVIASTHNGPLKSTDAGASWSAASTGITFPPSNSEFSGVFHPTDSAIVFAVDRSPTNNTFILYKSTNSGTSWQPLRIFSQFVGTMNIHPDSTNILIITTRSSSQGWVYVSRNLGLSFDSTSIPLEVYDLCFSPDEPSVFYVATYYQGVYRSEDLGKTFIPRNTGIDELRTLSLSISPVNKKIYVGTWGGTYSSGNKGLTWTYYGLYPHLIRKIIASPADSTEVFVTTEGAGIFRSTLVGNYLNIWSQRSQDVFSADVEDIILSPSSTLITATLGAGIFRKSLNDTLWQNVGLGFKFPDEIAFPYITRINFDPSDSSRVYAAGYYGRFYSSTDSGKSWKTSIIDSTAYVVSFAVDQKLPTCIYAGLDNNKGMFRSTDAGKHWSAFALFNETVWSIAVNPLNSNTIYAATVDKIFRSDNAGINWTRLDTSNTKVYNAPRMYISPSDTNVIFHVANEIVRSSNRGETWSKPTLPSLLSPRNIQFSKKNAKGLYMPTTGNIMYSGDNGLTWKILRTQTTGMGTFTCGIVDEIRQIAYMGTRDRSVWSVTVPPQTHVIQEVELPSLSLEQNYPNPFNPSTTIRYSLPSSANVKLVIYDLLGKEIATLVNEEQSAGWKEVEWNASAFSSGIYFYKLSAGNYVGVKKLMVLK